MQLPFPVAIGKSGEGPELLPRYERRIIEPALYKSMAFALLAAPVRSRLGPVPAPVEAAPAAASPSSDVQAASPVSGTPNPELKPNPIEEMRKFEPAADGDCGLGQRRRNYGRFCRTDRFAGQAGGGTRRAASPCRFPARSVLSGLTRSEAAESIEEWSCSLYCSSLAAQVTVTRYAGTASVSAGSGGASRAP